MRPKLEVNGSSHTDRPRRSLHVQPTSMTVREDERREAFPRSWKGSHRMTRPHPPPRSDRSRAGIGRRAASGPFLLLLVAVPLTVLDLSAADSGTAPATGYLSPSAAFGASVPDLPGPDTLPRARIDYDSLVQAGEIPPPDRGYAAELDSSGRAALRLPRASRVVHGTMAGNADFEICLPLEGWNGRLVVWVPGGAGTEHQGGARIRPAALAQGYGYATTDLGLSLSTMADPANRFTQARPSAVRLTRYAERLAARHYGRGPPDRTYVAGHSYGAHLATRLMEEHPEIYDAGIRHAGLNWIYQATRALAIWLRHRDVRPVEPVMYDVGARLPNGFAYRLGQERGTEDRWEVAAPGWRRLLAALIPAVDPSYDPNGDGELSPGEIERWDADERPSGVAGRLAGTAVTGRLAGKMIAFAGLADVFSPPSTERAYQRLVRETGTGGRVVLYLEEGAGHRHGFPARLDPAGEPTGFWPEALRTLDRWVVRDEPPGEITGISPR